MEIVKTMKNKTVLVTGAADGIGAAIVRKFISQGAENIIIIDRNAEGLESVCTEDVQKSQIFIVAVDLCNEHLLQEKLGPILQQVGIIDTVVISHGVADENLINDNLIWDKVIAVNLTATQRLLSQLEPHISSSGSITVISSILGLVGKISNTAYCSSKHALLGLVKGLALDLARRKIRVNSILPSWVDTPMLRNEIKKQSNLTGVTEKEMFRRIKKRIPLRSLVSAEDVADSVLFFASDKARMITAQSLVIDGGDGCGL